MRVVSCATCGAGLGPGDRFCGTCGAARPAETELPTDPQPASEAAPPATLEPAPVDPGTDVDPGRAPVDPGPVPVDAEAARVDAEAAPPATHLFDVPVDDEPTSTDIGRDADPDVDPSTSATTVIATTGGVELVTCSSCNSVNAAQRSRCAQCGTPLGESSTDEGQWDLAQQAPVAELPVEDPPDTPARRRGIPTWAWVVLAGLVVGVGIGVATALGLGPLAATSGPGVDFRASAYPDAPDVLAPSLVGGSDVREPADGRTFGAPNLLDGVLTTSWHPQDAVDAVVTFRFDEPVWVTALEVANGDQFDDQAYDQSGRVRLATIDMGRGQAVEATLIDGTGRQVLRFPTPALTTEVEVEVVEVTGGDDVAMSDVVIIGHPASERDATAYREGA